MRKLRIAILLSFFVGFAMSSGAHAETVKLAITDLVGLEELQREFGAFREKLNQITGLEVEFFPVSNRTAAVEALRFGKVDFVLSGPAEYVVMRKRTNAQIVVGFSRPDYFAVLITMADGGYAEPKKLKSQKVAFGSVGSTSKHLGPLQALADHGLKPSQDYQAIHTSLPIAWESLKKGEIAAVGMNHINFLEFREAESKKAGLPAGAFRVIARGPDLPNDVLMAGAHVDTAIITKMRQAFIEHSDALIKTILVGKDNQKYQGMKFITKVTDEDYDYVRAMYATAGYPEYTDFIGD